ncbi:hypothetical protein [Emticicia sp. 17c]|uniref:hypothetical protein n=1 Tax=Emticicia sp. 17c TaxID=3127704 RepID=UPI00301DE503
MFTVISKTKHTSNKTGDFLLTQSVQYLQSVLTIRANQIDTRLSHTFFDLFMAILVFCNQKMGLLLSELVSYMCGLAHTPAGAKRISNLLRSKKWESRRKLMATVTLVYDFLLLVIRNRSSFIAKLLKSVVIEQ